MNWWGPPEVPQEKHPSYLYELPDGFVTISYAWHRRRTIRGVLMLVVFLPLPTAVGTPWD